MHFSKIKTKTLLGLLSSLAALMLLGTPAYAAVERVIVGFQPGKSAEARSAISQGKGSVVVDLSRHNALAIEIPSQALKGLENNPNVAYVEPDLKRYPMAEVTPYGISMVQANDPGLAQPTSNSKAVCVIDSGYDSGHPDLQGNIVTGTEDSGTGSSLTDESGHGTHVAGTIAAIGDNGEGVVGVNSQGINLVIVKVFGASGWAYSSSLIAAHDVCRDEGAVITNMSLGGSRASRSERIAFDASNLLNIAAAGNDGNTRKSYPASYTSVMSVAAVDSSEMLASFSQRNSEVDIAAPGVGVKSTVPRGFGSEASVSGATGTFVGLGMEGSPNGSATGTLIDCGLGVEVCAAGGDAICLIQRGDISFADKVSNCEAGGGSAAVVYNNEPGVLSGTLGGASSDIVSIGISQADGAILQDQVGSTVTVTLGPSDYDTYDGTSMATPHVAGVAALVWSQPAAVNCSKDDIRGALEATAKDLGAPGRDDSYGHGLIQARAAVDYLGTDCGGGGGGQNQAPTAGFASNCDGLTCSFTDNSTDDGSIVGWNWSFGDGSTSTTQNPSHTFSSDGTYTVSLTVTDNEAATGDANEDVTVSSGGGGGIDADGDGYTVEDGDCNDNDASINPDARDRGGRKWSDGVDNDCNGIVDG